MQRRGDCHPLLRGHVCLIYFCLLIGLAPLRSFGEETQQEILLSAPPKISKAVMCEQVQEQQPYNETIVFSVSLQKAYCFTAFEAVAHQDYIFHNWYHQDKLTTKIKLSIQPPQWSTYSGIHFREADIGPWRVDITDKQGNVLKIIRFSITQ